MHCHLMLLLSKSINQKDHGIQYVFILFILFAQHATVDVSKKNLFDFARNNCFLSVCTLFLWIVFKRRYNQISIA